MDATLLRAFATLIGVSAALGGILFLVKKFASKSRKKIGGMNLEVISRVALQPKQQLYVVRAAEKILLIGATDQSINILSDLSGENMDEALAKTLNIPAQKKNSSQEKILPQTKISPELSNTSVGAEVPSFGDFLKSIIKGERVN